MLNVKTNADNVASNLDKFMKDFEKRLPTKLETAGMYLEKQMEHKIQAGLQPALKPKTIARKKSSKPLIDKGELIGHIDHLIDKNVVEVGVFGEEEAKIARHHEFGAPRANIPERSFMRSSFNESRGQIKKIMKQ